ncbi:hypothetical protein TNIN_496461 [Trichonephila inaurata madagascariensis]|uniref:Uncharacterized protein n=1 Tax=Trichonephila inaurata madagascariensis TaxID=2747483 RepID=A0A8X6X5G6_9ARAC|nr:hypothetical protein TNIN_496461 [Trichonephila inaurata madagascariensis]
MFRYLFELIVDHIPFENRRNAFTASRMRKILRNISCSSNFSTPISASIVVVGLLGSWDTENEPFLRKVATIAPQEILYVQLHSLESGYLHPEPDRGTTIRQELPGTCTP